MYGRTAQGTPYRLPRNDPILQAPRREKALLARLPRCGAFLCLLGLADLKIHSLPVSHLGRQ